jgi:predicted tellurium resistance membrane protein TerC
MDLFDPIFTSAGLISLLTLTALEIVLGIDNVIFISIVASRLPASQQSNARYFGLGAALVVRLLLLLVIKWIIGLNEPLFTLPFTIEGHDMGISGRDLILMVGGLFLIGKSTSEIHAKMEHAGAEESTGAKAAQSFAMVLLQIVFIDLVFSFDSILTAIGLVQEIVIMAIAIIISIGVMVFFVNQISTYVENHPTVKMLALSFLIMIGVMLVAEGFHFHFPKGYVYFAMAYSFIVELLNIRFRKKSGSQF